MIYFYMKPQHYRKGEMNMKIVELNMMNYIGRGIKVYLKDGRAINFKPTNLIAERRPNGKQYWIGQNDEGKTIEIHHHEIEFVVATNE